jgi:hypothetical protein
MLGKSGDGEDVSDGLEGSSPCSTGWIPGVPGVIGVGGGRRSPSSTEAEDGALSEALPSGGDRGSDSEGLLRPSVETKSLKFGDRLLLVA